MRLLKFINESSEIEKQCPKAWKTFEKVKLYRGMSDKPDLGKIVPFTDRRPLNSSLHFHNSMNQAFTKVFGNPLRSTSVFCTGNKNFAKNYGTVYEIYPSDDFEVYWSPKIEDLAYAEAKELRGAPLEVQLLFALRVDTDYAFLSFVENLPRNKDLYRFTKRYFSEELEEAEETEDPEILFNACYNKFPSALADFFKNTYKKGDPIAAAKSGNEVMVTCSFYMFKKV